MKDLVYILLFCFGFPVLVLLFLALPPFGKFCFILILCIVIMGVYISVLRKKILKSECILRQSVNPPSFTNPYEAEHRAALKELRYTQLQRHDSEK